MRRGGGIGFVVLIVVVAVVLWLTARAWRAVAPTAAEVASPAEASDVDEARSEAGEAVRSGELPDLSKMRQETGQHADAVGEALKQVP